MQIRVLDLDGSLIDQPPVTSRLSDGRAELFGLRSFGMSLRLWAAKRSYEAFESFWRRLPRPSGPLLILIGSGDFHHLTASFVAAAEGPLTVVHFDNHPDWCWTMPRRHCGAWVNAVLAMTHVQRVVTIGPCSDDLVRPDRKGANLHALSEGRLELFPWQHAPSKVRKTILSGAGHTVDDGTIVWRNLAEANWSAFLNELIDRIPTRRVWITVDKDILSPEEAVTNWDQGALPLDRLVEAISRLTAAFEIVGADICGDYAPIRHRHPLKYLEARLDQPWTPSAEAAATRARAIEVNARANERLIAAFEDAQ
jgi:arginase family enzyme